MLRTNPTFLSFMERFEAQNPDSGIRLKSFPKGFRFIEQGDQIRNIYIIKEGITKCFILEENGKDYIVEFLGKGEVAGELEAIKKISCLCTVEAIGAVEAYIIPDHIFHELVASNPEFNQLLLHELATRVFQMSSRASFQQLYTLDHGLSKLLKLEAEENISISKEDMASYLGISVRSLNRSLQQLKLRSQI